jgi:hypothetical protein
MQFLSYLVAAMVAWCPVTDHRFYQHGSNMTDDERDAHTLTRYASIAQDVEDVVKETKPVFDGPFARVRTALVVLAIASYESGGYREDIDNTKRTGGNAHCIMQIEFPLRDGEVMRDRKDCIRIGLERARESMAACPRYPVLDQLAVYARGRCNHHWGLNNSRMKMGRAMKWFHDYEFITLDGGADE